MKYCPYCGADFADGAASFCMECGKSLPIAEDGQKKPKEKPVKSQKRMEKKRKHPSPKSRKKHEKPVGEHMGGAFHPKDDGYDGYYDDDGYPQDGYGYDDSYGDGRPDSYENGYDDGYSYGNGGGDYEQEENRTYKDRQYGQKKGIDRRTGRR